MDLQKLKDTWERFAQTDPTWAIRTVPDKLGNRWEAEDFFRSGEIEIDGVLRTAREVGIRLSRGPALDLGCGVGRLTQALCRHFEHGYGVDSTELASAYWNLMSARKGSHGSRIGVQLASRFGPRF